MHDQLADRFAAFEADVSGHVRPVASDRVRARGDRGRAKAAVTSAVVVGTLAALGTVAAVNATTGTVVEAPQSNLKIPADLKLPHDGEAGWRADNAAGAVPEGLRRCTSGDPMLTGRTDTRGATGPGRPGEEAHSPTVVVEQLILFQDDRAAKSAVAALLAKGTQCGYTFPGMGEQLSLSKLTGEYPNATLVRIAGFRAGNAVFLVSTTTRGALMSSAGTTELSVIADRLCTVMGLCEPSTYISPLNGGSPQPQGTGSPMVGTSK